MQKEWLLDGQYLGTISGDFVKIADKIKEASYLIERQGSYDYPVFLAAKTPLSMGALLIEKNELNNRWYYYAAYLNALVQYGLIAEDKISDFQSTYKNPREFCCLLVVDTTFTKFVYIPYPEG